MSYFHFKNFSSAAKFRSSKLKVCKAQIKSIWSDSIQQICLAIPWYLLDTQLIAKTLGISVHIIETKYN